MAKKKKRKAGKTGTATTPQATPPVTEEDSSHTDLLAALESIKGLLEQGEEKLSIARESIQRANDSSHTRPTADKASLAGDDEEIVPVLDDIVDPDELDIEMPVAQRATTPPEQKPAVPEATAPNDTAPAPRTATRTEKTMKTVLDDELIDNIQQELEQVLRERLMKSMIRLENELKSEIRKQLDKLRDND